MQPLIVQLTDQELVKRVLLTGDEQAFRHLYGRHTPRLLGLARNLTVGSALDADDLVQEMWLRAAGRLGGFEWRSSLRTWLSGILMNLVREAHRAASRLEFLELDDEAAAWPPPPDPADRLELQAALAALGPGQRAVLVLHDVEGYTHEEIADLLDISPGTSKSQLSRARRAVVLFMNNERKKQPHVRT